MKKFVALLFNIWSLALCAEEPVRTWTNLKGATLKAGFVKFAEDKIVIRRDDGRFFTVSPEIFSEGDRKYQDEIRKKLNPARTPTVQEMMDLLKEALPKCRILF